MKSLIDKFKDLIIKYGSPKVAWDNCPKQLQKELEKNYPYTFPILYGRKYGYRGFICDQYIIRVTNITDSHHLKFDSESQVIDHIVPIMVVTEDWDKVLENAPAEYSRQILKNYLGFHC